MTAHVSDGFPLDWRGSLHRTPESDLIIAGSVLLILFALLNSSYVNPNSLAQVLVGSAFIGVITLGQAWLLLTGEFDLSVGSVAAFSSVVGALAMRSTDSALLGVAVCLAVGAAFGALNAFTVLILGLPSFIATIGTGFIAAGLAVFITNGDPVYPLPAALTDLGLAAPLGLSLGVFIFLILGAALNFLSRNTRLGRESIAVGGEPTTARIAGIRVLQRKTIAFLMCSSLAALAGMVQVAAQGTAVPQLGTNAELASVAAAVVGGVSIFGGSGSITGAICGVLFLKILTTGLASTGVSTSWQTFSVGIVLIIAIALDVARRRRKGLS